VYVRYELNLHSSVNAYNLWLKEVNSNYYNIEKKMLTEILILVIRQYNIYVCDMVLKSYN
jgi:hypothetical protein